MHDTMPPVTLTNHFTVLSLNLYTSTNLQRIYYISFSEISQHT